MKFLCPQCKAKYQIADEKVEGRTLRMQCRKCSSDIVIRNGSVALGGSGLSEAPPGGAESIKLSMAPRAGGSGVGPLPARGAPSVARPGASTAAAPRPASALQTDFKRAGTVPSPSKAPAALDVWHVSINDVPVGPIRRDELAKKIASGAVTGESLAWREGYDDWRPVKDIVELAPLLRRSLPPAAPPATGAKPAPPRPLAPVRTGGGAKAPAPKVAAPAPKAAAPAPAKPAPPPRAQPAPGRVATAASAAQATSVAPAAPASQPARSNVVPIGGRLGATPGPAVDELHGFMNEDEPTRVAESASFDMVPVPVSMNAAAPAPATPAPATPAAKPAPKYEATAPEAHRPRTSMIESIVPKKFRSQKRGVNIGIAFALIAGAVFIAALSAVLALKFLAPKPQVVERIVEREGQERIVYRDRIVEVPAAGTAQPPETQESTKRTTTTKREPTKVAANDTQNSGSTIDFNQFADNGSALPNIARPRSTTDDDAPGTGPGGELSAESVRATLNRGRGQVQQCYEQAARQSGSTNSMRVDVSIVVGSGGRPTRVTATGDVVSLNRCVEGVVRRWVFAGTGEASFPLVFQPGG